MCVCVCVQEVKSGRKAVQGRGRPVAGAKEALATMMAEQEQKKVRGGGRI